MTRMSGDEFGEHCGNQDLHGYVLYDGQTLPETYQDLVAFIAHRIGLSENEFSVSALSHWLMNNEQLETSCSPELDTMHVTSVVLMSDLKDADAYVASFPEFPECVLLPPPEAVRRIINLQ
jgi:hypothetical protein